MEKYKGRKKRTGDQLLRSLVLLFSLSVHGMEENKDDINNNQDVFEHVLYSTHYIKYPLRTGREKITERRPSCPGAQNL
jgi:hypothetical protein